jgi:hypothetical protein
VLPVANGVYYAGKILKDILSLLSAVKQQGSGAYCLLHEFEGRKDAYEVILSLVVGYQP